MVKYCCAKVFCLAPDFVVGAEGVTCARCKGWMHPFCTGADDENKYNCLMCSLPVVPAPRIVPQIDFLDRIANGEYILNFMF